MDHQNRQPPLRQCRREVTFALGPKQYSRRRPDHRSRPSMFPSPLPSQRSSVRAQARSGVRRPLEPGWTARQAGTPQTAWQRENWTHVRLSGPYIACVPTPSSTTGSSGRKSTGCDTPSGPTATVRETRLEGRQVKLRHGDGELGPARRGDLRDYAVDRDEVSRWFTAEPRALNSDGFTFGERGGLHGQNRGLRGACAAGGLQFALNERRCCKVHGRDRDGRLSNAPNGHQSRAVHFGNPPVGGSPIHEFFGQCVAVGVGDVCGELMRFVNVPET